MALNVPIRYINDGEPLNEETLNRYGLDSQTNLEVLFNSVDGYDPGTVEAEANRVVLRDDQGRSKFGVPTDDQHPWRVAEYKTFREFLLDAQDFVRNKRLRKSSTSQEGIVQLVDSYSDTSVVKAPTADALRRSIRDVEDQITAVSQELENSKISLATTIFQDDNRNGVATTPKAVWDALQEYGGSGVESDYIPEGSTASWSGGVGWLRFDNGYMIQAGSALTGTDGKREVVFPQSFTTDYVIVMSERHASGWDFEIGNIYRAPTVYGHDRGTNWSLASADIIGVRILDYSAPAPKVEANMLFGWIAFGF